MQHCFSQPIQPPVTLVRGSCVCVSVCENESMRPALWPIWTLNEIIMCQNIKWDSFLILERHFLPSVSQFCHTFPAATSVSVSLPLRSPLCLFPSFPLLLFPSCSPLCAAPLLALRSALYAPRSEQTPNAREFMLHFYPPSLPNGIIFEESNLSLKVKRSAALYAAPSEIVKLHLPAGSQRRSSAVPPDLLPPTPFIHTLLLFNFLVCSAVSALWSLCQRALGP